MHAVRTRIAVVEDDEGMNQALERLLRASGFDVLRFSSAEAFLADGAAGKVACAIFDVQLPGLSGLELHRRLRKDGVELPVVFITAYEDASTKAEIREERGCGHLTKPFDHQSLLRAIDAALVST